MVAITTEKIYRFLSNIIVPPFCSLCKKFLSSEDIFCNQCKDTITPIVSATRSITKKYNMKIFAVSDYQDPLKKLILAKRWGDIAASNQLGKILWDMSYIRQVDFDSIVPIPLHWTRFARRGFNQADEIARVLAKKSGKPIESLLKRVKRTAYQSELVYTKRRDNLKNAFELKSKERNNYRNKRLLLVDDLMTTGATLHAAARTLLPLKPHAIIAAVICRSL